MCCKSDFYSVVCTINHIHYNDGVRASITIQLGFFYCTLQINNAESTTTKVTVSEPYKVNYIPQVCSN